MRHGKKPMHFGYQPRSTLVQPARLEENPHIGKRRMRHPFTLAATVVLALCFVMFGAPATTPPLFAQGGATERTPETLSKYRASAVEYTAREYSVTIHSRQFRGAGGDGGARRWRQLFSPTAMASHIQYPSAFTDDDAVPLIEEPESGQVSRVLDADDSAPTPHAHDRESRDS